MRRQIAALLLFALACGTKEPDAERVRKSVASWDASLALAANAWVAHHLPDHFVRDAVEAAVDDVSKDASGNVPKPVIDASARALALAHQLREAVEHDDRAAASRIGRELEAQAKELR